MSRPLTLEDLKRINTGTHVLADLSAKLGEEVTATFGTIQRLQWMALWPDPISGQDGWPAAEFEVRREEWLKQQTPAARAGYWVAWAKTSAAVVAAATKVPVMTEEDALSLGADLEPLTAAILRLSGLIPPEPKRAASEPDEVPAAVESAAA